MRAVAVVGRPLLVCDALRSLLARQPGLAVVDRDALEGDGADAPTVDVVVVVGRDADEEARLSARWRERVPGADVVAARGEDGEPRPVGRLLHALRASAPATPSIAVLDPDPSRRFAELTSREIDVLSGMAEGRTEAQIATQLDLSPRTVVHHKRRIFEKLGVRSQTQAVASALRDGVVLRGDGR